MIEILTLPSNTLSSLGTILWGMSWIEYHLSIVDDEL